MRQPLVRNRVQIPIALSRIPPLHFNLHSVIEKDENTYDAFSSSAVPCQYSTKHRTHLRMSRSFIVLQHQRLCRDTTIWRYTKISGVLLPFTEVQKESLGRHMFFASGNNRAVELSCDTRSKSVSTSCHVCSCMPGRRSISLHFPFATRLFPLLCLCFQLVERHGEIPDMIFFESIWRLIHDTPPN